MAELVLVIGKSGCGKSTSLRNLPPEETCIFVPNSKTLPFPGAANMYKEGENLIVNSELDDIQGLVQHVNDNMKNVKTLVIEDFTHCFTARIFDPVFLSRNTGGEAFARWNDFGASVYQALFAMCDQWRDDLYIVVLHHTEIKEDGTIGFRSSGKLLDNTIDIPSYFNYMFHALVQKADNAIGKRYVFQTNEDSVRQAKTIHGAFPDQFIGNDLHKILTRIRDFKAGKVDMSKIKFIE
jgi:energy-coupling factor transporter ATP-binding protein EcfA2